MIAEYRQKKIVIFAFVLAVFFAAAIFAGIYLGSTQIPLSEIKDILFAKKSVSRFAIIILEVRLPRVILALIVGANLAAAGALFQAVIQNPLADPGIIGISAGAKLGLLLALLVFPNFVTAAPLFAFLGAMGAAVTVYLLAWKSGIKTVRLILAGVAVNAFLAGASYLITLLNNDKIQNIMLWLSGSLSGRSINDVKVILPYSIIGLAAAMLSIRPSNLLLFGDEKALSLGLNINTSRLFISFTAAFLAAISTSLAGVIGFVGLVIPHIVRLITGPNYKYVLPFSIVTGGIFLLIADTVARTIASPLELPVGSLMALIGGPFFVYLLRKKKA
ncbi:FecCD family ABC transporter permease [Treponema pedis]|uniref:FecCD family ABC transporter permease n=1 Tax=Treponema pedis TaxID=409322 RepID=UPI003D1E39A9